MYFVWPLQKKWTPFSKLPATFFESKARDLFTLRSEDFQMRFEVLTKMIREFPLYNVLVISFGEIVQLFVKFNMNIIFSL